MKKFFTLLVTAVAATSCQHYDEIATLPTEGYSIEVGIDDDTRTYFESLGSTYRHYWEADDAISVFALSGENDKFALTAGAGTRQATFTGNTATADASQIYVVYPYNEENKLVGTTFQIAYPEVQTARTDRSSYDREAHLMIGHNDGDIVQLRNISAYLRISLTGNATVSSIKVSSIGNEPFAGKASAIFKGDEPQITLEGDASIVKLECNVELTATATDFYIAVAPSSLAHGFAVTVEDSEGMSMTRKHSNAVEFRRNTVYEMPELAYTPDKDPNQTVNIFNETFGEPKNGTLLTKGTNQRQLVNYFDGFTPTGAGASSAAYWGGLRVDLMHGTKFESENANDGYLYFGNSNNGGLGTNDGSLASYSAIYDYNETHPTAHINDDLTFYVYNVNVGAATQAVSMSFDVAYNTYTSLVDKNGGDNSLFAHWIKAEYTPDFGKTWIDISGDCQTENKVFHYTTQSVDLTSYRDQFISFRITPRFKQTLLLDNLSFDILGDPSTIEANNAPSVVEIYRQTPTTAYLICRPAAGTHMTEAEMKTVVPHICVAEGSLAACENFEIYRADEKHQIFEIIIRNLPQYLNERWAALEYAGQIGGKKSFYESGSNEIINVNFDHFIAGTDPIGSIRLGHNLLNWHSVFSVGGAANANNATNLGGFNAMHDPLMNIRDIEYRQEQGSTFANGGDGKMTSNAFRIGNNMEASFRHSAGFYESGTDITTNGAQNDGKFFRFECEMDGWHGLLLYGLRGYMQLGTGSTTWYGDATASKQVWIRTPALGERAAGKSVVLSFDAARYNNVSCTELTIVVENGGTFADGQTTKNVSAGSTMDFVTSTVEINGCTADTKIKIGPASAASYPGGYGRFFLDNIRVVL